MLNSYGGYIELNFDKIRRGRDTAEYLDCSLPRRSIF